MVLLGGIQTLAGPIVGASVFAVLQDKVMRQTEYWHALLGGIILVLVLAFPAGHCRCVVAARRPAGAGHERAFESCLAAQELRRRPRRR